MNISFFYTTQQIIDETKTETTRRGWDRAKVGLILDTCRKCQGLKKGQHVEKLKKIRITKVEPIEARPENYTQADVNAERFPELTPDSFFKEILQGKCKVKLGEPVKRITFEYI